MKQQVTTSTESQAFAWSLTADEFLDLNDYCADRFGQPEVTRNGEPYDLDHHIDIRMGEIGSPKKEITVTPVEEPSRQPEPISTPVPEREPEKVPA